MRILTTSLVGCVTIQPVVHEDVRGFFLETFQAERYAKAAGIHSPFVQDNFSHSHKNVLRGLHFQRTRPQGRLVRVVYGEIFDVVVDIRADSASLGSWESFILSDKNHKELWIPPGFAHGFLSLSKSVGLEYKCTEYYDASDEECIRWNDPELGIPWPVDDPILSERDAAGKDLKEILR